MPPAVEQPSRPAREQPIDGVSELAETYVQFITGFPCTKYRCNGTLIESVYADHPAIKCSICEHVYYVVRSE